jgi:hypothetical protein
LEGYVQGDEGNLLPELDQLPLATEISTSSDHNSNVPAVILSTVSDNSPKDTDPKEKRESSQIPWRRQMTKANTKPIQLKLPRVIRSQIILK